LSHLNTLAAVEPNRLLAALPSTLYDALLPNLESVHLEHGQVLARPKEPMQAAYFPRGAVTSVLVPMEDGSAVETATIGREGMIGLPLFLSGGIGHDKVICQIDGRAACLPAAAFREAVAAREFQELLHHYTLALMGQMARTTGCNRSHSIEQRSARWLLLIHNSVGRDDFYLPHTFLATVLGVRRPSVTVAAGQMQKAGLIRYKHSHLIIRDRKGLETRACADYQRTCDLYDRLYVTQGAADGAATVPQDDY
jgi:CRP-like cAMP-binding protein